MVDAFRLRNAPARFSVPLVLRRLLPLKDPAQLLREEAVHAALREQDSPAPRVLVVETRAEVIGAPFLVAERVPGRVPLQEVTRPGQLAARPMRFPGLIRDALFVVAPLLGETQARLHDLDPEPLRHHLRAAGIAPESVGFDARLAELTRRVESEQLDGLSPGLGWLHAQRPAPQPDAICHGDLVFTNLCVEAGRLTGVFDWSNVCLAEPAYDVGATLARLSSRVPNLPWAVDRLMRGVQERLERRYLRAYRRRRSLDPERVAYFEACWVLSELTWSGLRLRAGGEPDDAIEHRWLHRATIEAGVERFAAATGVRLAPLMPEAP